MRSDNSPFDRLGAGAAQLRLLATSDLHGNLLGYDYRADRAAGGTGLAALAQAIARLRQGPGATLLFDNGDVLQGTPLGEAGTDGAGDMPVALAFDALGYDAATLGNHDFDFGVAAARRLARSTRCAVVLGNVTEPDGAPFLPPFAVLERQVTDGAGQAHPLRLGVLGLTTPGVARWNAHHLDGALRV
ncbi:MAG: Calcineurin-like phosphoesterase, partial [Rhodobacteraceae bacterium HLUCCA24]